jgi:hypothetical protein
LDLEKVLLPQFPSSLQMAKTLILKFVLHALLGGSFYSVKRCRKIIQIFLPIYLFSFKVTTLPSYPLELLKTSPSFVLGWAPLCGIYQKGPQVRLERSQNSLALHPKFSKTTSSIQSLLLHVDLNWRLAFSLWFYESYLTFFPIFSYGLGNFSL